MTPNLKLIAICILSWISMSPVYGGSSDDDPYRYCTNVIKFDAAVNRTGHFYSPLYGKENYPTPIECQYELKVPKGWRVKFTFKDLDIFLSDICFHGGLSFYGVGPYSPTFCGSDIPRPIFTQNETDILIFFTSGRFKSGRGFHLYYEAGPDIDDCPENHIVCRNRNCVPNNKKCDGKDDCGDGTDEQECEFPVVAPEVCGKTFYEPNSVHDSPGRIVGGEEAVPHSWPSQVLLQLSFQEPSGHICTGTLINSQWVLTTSHCFEVIPYPLLAKSVRIHLGVHYKYKKETGVQIRYAEKIIGYPDLEMLPWKKTYDLYGTALVKLNAPVSFTKTVQPACLPNPGQDLPLGTKCYELGWVITIANRDFESWMNLEFSDRLKQVLLTSESTECCPHDPKHQFCAANPRGSSILGVIADAGGPFICNLDGRWTVMGIKSHTVRLGEVYKSCNLESARTVFSEVSDKINWIKTIVNKYS